MHSSKLKMFLSFCVWFRLSVWCCHRKACNLFIFINLQLKIDLSQFISYLFSLSIENKNKFDMDQLSFKFIWTLTVRLKHHTPPHIYIQGYAINEFVENFWRRQKPGLSWRILTHGSLKGGRDISKRKGTSLSFIAA